MTKLQQYGLAIITASLAFAIGWLLDAPVSCFFLAVFVSTLYGTRGPALLSAALAIFGFLLELYFQNLLHSVFSFRFALFVTSLVLIIWLVEARRKSIEARQWVDDQYRLVAQTAPDAILAMNDRAQITLANPGAARIFGWEVNEFVGEPATTLIPNFRLETFSGVRESIGVRKDGRAFPAEISFGSVEGKGARCFTIFVRDITEQKRASETLRTSESYLAEAQRLSKTGSFGWNVSSGELYWSEETYRILGCPRDRRPMLDLVLDRVHPEDRDRIKGIFARAMQKLTDLDFEHRFLMPDGSVKHMRVRAHAVKGVSGRVEYIGAATDCSDRKRAEEALRQSESYLTEAQKITHTGSWAWAIKPRTALYLSEEWFRIYGFDPQAGMPSFEARVERTHPEDRARWQQTFEGAIADKSDFESEFRLLLPDGTTKHIYGVGHPVFNAAGDVSHFVGTSTDVTQRKLAEEEVRRREQEFRLIVNTIPGLVCTATPQGQFEHVNQRILDYTGLTVEELADWSKFLHPADLEPLQHQWFRAIAEGAPFEGEYRLRHFDGAYRWFQSRALPLRNEEGKIQRWYHLITDIEEQKQTEGKLRVAFAEIEKLRDQLYQENLALKEEIDQASMFEEIVGCSDPLRQVLVQVAKVAPTDSTVLITGETGTGKELIARAIHNRSARSHHAFIRVNCAAIPQSLITSELFGHEKGAFTGAIQRRIGRFELAHGGTILIDEVGELPLETQVALLRVLQEREVERIGGNGAISVDVRVLAASNRDLESLVEAGTFRQDLFYRLNVFPVHVPPLRDRVDDIPLLVEYLIERYAKKAGKKIDQIRKKTLELFQAYDWPGNVRELQNVVERAVVLCNNDTFSVDETWLRHELHRQPERVITMKGLGCVVDQERQIIEAALSECGGRIAGPTGAAAKLGLPRQTLDSKIISLGIDKRRFKRA